MALVKRADGTFLINQNPLQFGLIRQARALFNVPLQRARDLAAELRGAGVECYAASEMGTENDDAWEPPTAAVDLSVSWPSTWQISPIERLSEHRFVHSFVDSTGTQQSVIGRTPQEVVDRLSARFDFEARQYVASITPVPEPPTAVPEAPIPEGPRKFIRAGDRHYLTPEEVADLAAQRAFHETPKAPPIEVEYLNFFNSSSSGEVSRRKQKDPQFFEWMKSQGLLFGRSEEHARN
jgi:hypothetical protein